MPVSSKLVTARSAIRHWLVFCVSAFLFLFIGPIALAETAVPTMAELKDSAMQEMRLSECEIVSLQAPQAMDAEVTLRVPIDGVEAELILHPHSVRADGYRLIVQVGENDYMDLTPGPERTFRGTIDGVNGAKVAGAVLDDGVMVRVIYPDGREYWVEPLAARVPVAGAEHHVIYKTEDILDGGNTCATEHGPRNLAEPDQPGTAGNGCGSLPCLTELACDADFEYYDDYNQNPASVEGRISTVTNVMNLQYENEVGITHGITAILIRTVPGLPYTDTGSLGLLTQFRNQWLNNHDDIARDVAELFSGKEIDGTTIGRAWDIGAICTTSSYCFVQSDCCGGLGCATDLSAHELGHLWNGIHCDCTQFTMNPSIACQNRFTPELNIPRIIGHRNTRSCLTSLAPSSDLPFFDDFPELQINDNLWVSEGAQPSDVGLSEPSPPFSLRLNADDRVYSAILDASTSCLILEYAWQRTGNGGSPEPGEDLIVDFASETGQWIQVALHPGSGPDFQPFEEERHILPPESRHENFQVRIRVVNAEAADDFFVDDVRITPLPLATITSQPVTQFSCIGGDATFSVEADGDDALSYQWYLNEVQISGADGSVLTVSEITEADIGSYSVEVSNECSVSVSASAPIVDFGPPSITSQPFGASVEPGENFFAFVGATGAMTYQWFHNDEPIEAAVESFLNLPSVTCADAGQYFCRVINGCDTVDSDTVELDVAGVKLQGDFDDDNDIDLADFGSLQLCFGVEGASPSELAACGCVFDFDGDNGIDLDDYAAFFDAATGP